MKIDNNLKNIFDSLYDGILIIDKSGIVVYVNPSYTRITKIDKEDIENKRLLDVRKDRIRENIKIFIRRWTIWKLIIT